jgi:hypothetical protein
MKKGKSRKCICRKNFMKNQKQAAKRSGNRVDPRKTYNHKNYDGSQNQEQET